MRNPLANLLVLKSKAYKKVFDTKNPHAYRVLADLRKFCRGTGSKWMGDYEKTLIQLGRNEVWERINSYLHLPDDQLAKIVEQLDND